MARVLPASWLDARATPAPPMPVVAALVLAAAGIVLLPLPYNVAAVVGVATIVLMVQRPLWGLYLVLLSVPVQDVGAPRFGDVAITATKVIVPLALLAWLALRLTRGGWRLAPSWLMLPYGLYVMVLAGSTMIAASQSEALAETSRWLQAFGVFLMTLDLVRTRRALAGVVAVLLLGGVAQALLGLVQSGLGAGPASFAVEAGFSRAFGTFGMPNSYAGYLEMTLPLALALSAWLLAGRPSLRPLAARSPIARLAWLAVPAAALLLLAAIGASYSRGAWLGTAIGMAVMIVVAGRRWLVSTAVLAVVTGIVLSLGGTAFLPAEFTDRFGSIADSFGYRDVRRMVITPDNFAVAERLAMWYAGTQMFAEHPISGVGAGNYNVRYRDYRVPQFPISRGHAHNYYLHVAAETGLIGLAAYALLLVAAWGDLIRARLQLRDPWLRALTVGAGGILAAVMTHNLVENLHVLNMNLHLFAALALPALSRRVQSEEEATA